MDESYPQRPDEIAGVNFSQAPERYHARTQILRGLRRVWG